MGAVADEDLETDHIDAVKAFTQAPVDCEVYVMMPFGFRVDGHVLKLAKALEGLRQGAFLFWRLLHGVLIKIGFLASLAHPNLYSLPPEVARIVAVRTMLDDEDMLGRGVKGPTVTLGDNQAQYDITVKPGLSARTRYFERAVLVAKRLFMLHIIAPYVIETFHMVADVFTKPLEARQFHRLRDWLLNVQNSSSVKANGIGARASRLLAQLAGIASRRTRAA